MSAGKDSAAARGVPSPGTAVTPAAGTAVAPGTGTTVAATASADWRALETQLMPPILQAALDCFASQGYHGTSIREIASRAGLSVPGVYHHHASKQALLVSVMEHAMEDLWQRSVAAAAEAGDDPVDQLAAQVECLVLYHARRQDLAFIAWSEIRSLTGEHLVAHLGRRDRQQRVFDEILETGVAAGAFRNPWPLDTSRAIVTLCTSVAQWYRVGGPLPPEELASRYVTLALGMAQATR